MDASFWNNSSGTFPHFGSFFSAIFEPHLQPATASHFQKRSLQRQSVGISSRSSHKLEPVVRKVAAKLTATKPTATKQTAAKQTATNPAAIKQTATKQTSTKQTATKQTANKQTATKQTATKQTATKQTISKQTAKFTAVGWPSKMKRTTTAEIPCPPTWSKHCQETTASMATYKLFSVNSSTSEYAVISDLIHPVKVTSVEQIVNPSLWDRFVSTRTDMLKRKSGNMDLLATLGLKENELKVCRQHLDNFKMNPKVDAVPYNENMALLFHCTRPENVEAILTEGLDDRMANPGLLGKGIYFTDDFRKSIQYDYCKGVILVFAVLLGDCLSLKGLDSTEKNFVKEPRKDPKQKRNPNDLCFDSIIDQPNGYNEYVIYDRYRCCPLYKINYQPKKGDFSVCGKDFNSAVRQFVPSCTWMPSNDGVAMPIKEDSCPWPFYAASIIEKMRLQQKTGTVSNDSPKVKEQLRMLNFLGFYDDINNFELLMQNKFNFDAAVSRLLELESDGDSDSDIDSDCDEEYDSCHLCYENYDYDDSNWILECNHEICIDCYECYSTTRSTFSGVEYTFFKCSLCRKTDGVEIGNCPKGKMEVTNSSKPISGYAKNSIRIVYTFEKHPLEVCSYLPDNDEGNEILGLLRIAWDRRLIFRTNEKGVLVSNIVHKKSRNGGSEEFENYFRRVKFELKTCGVE